MRTLRCRKATTLLFFVCSAAALAQTQAKLNRRYDLILEKKDGSSPRTMDPAHIFEQGDLIRFRLRPGVNGFLYVLNHGSSGKYEQLFPRAGASQDREVRMAHDYIIPDSDSGWFRIQGPAGYETVYFLISPMDLGRSLYPHAHEEQAPSKEPTHTETPDDKAFESATPRCDDELFRARGECLDTKAGLKPVQPGETLPSNLPPVSVGSRDLVIVKGSSDTAVSSTEPFDTPVVYHFKIAHK
jgi:hypothetical protein